MTDEQLIEGMRAGDEQSLSILVDRYQQLVLNTCNSFINSPEDAEEVAQDVFIAAYTTIDRFRKGSKLSTWLYRIAVNKSLNFIRDNKKRSIFKSIEQFFRGEENAALQLADKSTLYEDDVSRDEEKVELLHRSIQALKKNQRIAFSLSKLEKLSYAEVAEVMEISLAAVEGLVHRARKNIEKSILKYYQNKKS